jgi:4-hydroxy-3-polyprenylbenzoate decarboxylase
LVIYRRRTDAAVSGNPVVNTSLAQNIPVLLLGVEKNRKGHIAQLHNQVCAFEKVEGIKLILYVEHTVDAA